MKKVLASVLAVVMLLMCIPLGAVSVSAASRYEVINTKNVTGQNIVDEARKWANRGATYWSHYEPWEESIYWRTGYTLQGRTSFDCSGFVSRVLNDCGFRSSNYTPPYGSCILSEKYGSGFIGISPEDIVNYGEDISDAVLKAKAGDYSGLQPGDIIGWMNGNDRHVLIYAGLKSGTPWMVEFTGSGYLDRAITADYQNRFQRGARVADLDNSTPELISQKYNSHCNIMITSDNAYVKSMPCSKDTDPDSVDVEKAHKGDAYEAMMLCKNKWGLLWYQVKARNGKTGYVYAGDTKFIDQRLDDVGVDDPVSPTNIKKGNPFSIGGHIYSTHQAITRVQAWVTNTDDTVDYLYGHADNLVTASYDLGGSAVDNMLKFDSLGVGTYRYVVRVRVDSYYAADSKTIAATYYDELYLDECESVFTVTNSSCSHSYDVTVKNPSCTEGGYSTYVCKHCGAQYDSDYVEATGHYYETVVTKPTCTRQGFTEHCCQWCEDYYKDSYVDPLGHSYKGWITAEATCGADGVMTYTCSSCGDSYTEAIPAIGNHTYDNDCDTTCNICGEEREVAGHDYVLESFTDATCDFYGIAVYVCSKCGIYYSETIPATGAHTYDDDYDADCNVCGALREVPEKPPVTPDLPADAPAFVVDGTAARAGEEFTIAIRTLRNSGIVSFKLKVAYDADVLELVSVTEKDFAGMTFSPLTANPFILNWVDAIHPNNTTDGVMALVTFRVKENAPIGGTAVTITYDPDDVYDQNFDNVGFRVEDDVVEIVEYTPGDVTNDGKINNKDLGILQQYLNAWDVSISEKGADANGDGKVNNKDLGLLQQYLNEWDVTLG